MADTELLPVDIGAANSSVITVTIDAPVTVMMKGDDGSKAPSAYQIDIYRQDDTGAYHIVGWLRAEPERRSSTISGPGIYRLTRTAESASCGACRS